MKEPFESIVRIAARYAEEIEANTEFETMTAGKSTLI
jgi:hypothetical protein